MNDPHGHLTRDWWDYRWSKDSSPQFDALFHYCATRERFDILADEIEYFGRAEADPRGEIVFARAAYRLAKKKVESLGLLSEAQRWYHGKEWGR